MPHATPPATTPLSCVASCERMSSTRHSWAHVDYYYASPAHKCQSERSLAMEIGEQTV